MNPWTEYNPNKRIPDDLPVDLAPDLVDIDERLADEARRVVVPPHLSRRVFAASRGLLPHPVLHEAGASDSRAAGLGRVLPFSRTVRTVLWGRLAMAASLGMAFVMTAMFLRLPRQLEPAVDSPAVLVAEFDMFERINQSTVEIPTTDWDDVEMAFDITVADVRASIAPAMDEFDLTEM